MKDKTLMGGILFTVIGVVALSALWFLVLRDSEVASEPITSVPLSGTDKEATLFEITSESEARFTLAEVLRGVPTTVVGFTNQVSGQIAVDYDNLANTTLGEVRINARSLQTDNDFRNTAIRNHILVTSDHEYIRFLPQAISKLPTSAGVAERLEFSVTGDLIIREVSQEVTFAVIALPVTVSRLEGQATATIERADFNLTIPEVPSVANVDEEVLLEIQFVAEAIP